MLRRKGEFVAMIKKDGRFVTLIDREALVNKVLAQQTAAKPESQAFSHDGKHWAPGEGS